MDLKDNQNIHYSVDQLCDIEENVENTFKNVYLKQLKEFIKYIQFNFMKLLIVNFDFDFNID
jgi:hypothetical protein